MWGCNAGIPFGFGNWFWGHGFFGLLFSVLLITVLISLIVFAIRSLSARGALQQDRSHSMEILKAKYAAGAISEEEYRRMREILNS
ncbi:MAG: SHOCT domain-containing protein [Desulfobulbaceae bacterium]|nr:SHOCT domain-containing protein [Desulfobulbaceae bacterium]